MSFCFYFAVTNMQIKNRKIISKRKTPTLNKCNLLMKELLISVYLIKSPYLCVLKILIYSEVLLHLKCMNHFTGICVHILYSVIIAFFASYFFTFIITKDSSALSSCVFPSIQQTPIAERKLLRLKLPSLCFWIYVRGGQFFKWINVRPIREQ